MLTWCFFLLFVFGENGPLCALKRTSLVSSLDCVVLCLDSRTTVKKVRNSLTWFSHSSGAILVLESFWGEFLFLLQECLRLCFFLN